MKPTITPSALKTRQAWTLEQKIDHSVGVIEAFCVYCKEQGRTPSVSFSGGKDSTVLLDIARRFVDPAIKAVFCNTGNEFPENIRFVRQTENVTIIRPDMTPRQVLEKYGFPLVSKRQAQSVFEARTTKSEKFRNYLIGGCGNQKPGVIALKWRYLLNEPYMVSHMCCHILKKRPFHKYHKQTGELPIIGTMADESQLRGQQYIRRGGCNTFNENPDKSASFPLSIWTERDIWDYIRKFGIAYSPIYDEPGIKRTGCMFCGFGAQFPGDCRFRQLYNLHPKFYDYAMNLTNNGVTLRTALRRMGVMLPDEEQTLF